MLKMKYLIHVFFYGIPIITVKAIGQQWYWTYEITDFGNNIQFDSYALIDFDKGQYRLLDVDNPLYLPILTPRSKAPI